MKASYTKLGTAAVCGIALSALLVNRTAQAQRREQLAPVTVFKSDRITSADPSFRYAAAVVLDPALHSPLSPHDGASVIETSLDKDVFTKRAVIYKGLGEKGAPQMASLTPGQLAMAETLFTQADLSTAKSLAVTSSGIEGSASARELGLTEAQLKQQTISRLQAEIKTANTALSELR